MLVDGIQLAHVHIKTQESLKWGKVIIEFMEEMG